MSQVSCLDAQEVAHCGRLGDAALRVVQRYPLAIDYQIRVEFSTLKTERTALKISRTRYQARADVFGYIEHFYDPAAGTPHSAT
jgi:hypothetical protein